MESLYQQGQVVTIYRDPEREENPIGEVELLEYKSTSLPFVLDDNKLSKDLNKIYVLETWGAAVKKSNVFPTGYVLLCTKRVLYSVGQRTIYSTEPSESTGLIDSFKILENVDTSFWESRVDGSELNSELY